MLYLEEVDLAPGVGAWFTGRDRDVAAPPVGAAGNLAHRRPHRPVDLTRARRELGRRTGTDPQRFHLMHQVHGANVAVVDASTAEGAELRAVDGAVTSCAGRPLVVQVADCVPVLLAGTNAAGKPVVGVAHAGRAGVLAEVVPATVQAMGELGADTSGVRAAIGPSIGGCCYELPDEMVEDLAARHPEAVGRTTWGSPSVDLASAVAQQLADAGATQVRRSQGCTHCDPDERWFSHRRDATTGRQAGVVVVRGAA